MLCSQRFLQYQNSLVRNLSVSTGVNRLRSEWRRDRPPANTTLGDENILVSRKAYGGRSKVKAAVISDGNYSLPSKGIDKTLKILDVIYNEAGKHYQESKIIGKGSIIAVDGSELRSDLDSFSLLSKDQFKNIEIKEHVEGMLNEGKLYARVTTRPGQIGKCDGYILEGNELVTLIGKLKNKHII